MNTESSATSSTPSTPEAFPGARPASSHSPNLKTQPGQMGAIADGDPDLDFFRKAARPSASENPGKQDSSGRVTDRQDGAPTRSAAPTTPATPESLDPQGAPQASPRLLTLDDADDTSYEDDDKQPAAPVQPATQPATQPPAKPQVSQPNQPAEKFPAGRRNTDGLPPEIAEVVSNMSNKAWARLEPIVREYQQLQRERLAEHPDGYQLAPEYQQILQDHQQVTTEHSFAEEQLAAAMQGNDFYTIEHDTEGKIVRRGPFEATADNIKALREYTDSLRDTSKNIVAAARGFKEEHGKVHKQVSERIAAIIDPIFKPYGAKLDAMIDQHLSAFKLPKYVTSRSDVRNTAGLILLFNRSMAEIARLEKLVAANGAAPAPGQGRRAGQGGGTGGVPNPTLNGQAITDEDREFFKKAASRG